MNSISRWLLIPILLYGWLGLSAEAFAAIAPQIKDDARLFSADALEKANQKIKEIYREYNKDLFIQTVPNIPKNLQEKYKDMGKRQFFVDWAEKRAEDAGVKGIYVLICKEPAHLQIVVDRQTRAKAFTREDGQKLAKTMLEKFEDRTNEKRFDAGLLAGVDFVESTIRQNAPARSEARQEPRSPAHPNRSTGVPTGSGFGGSSIAGWVCIGVVVLLGIWLVFGLVRALSGGGGGYGPGGYGGYGGGGGGFLSSLMGGMFGAAAGMWMYNHFLGGGGWGSQAYGGDHSSTMPMDTDAGAGDFSGGDAGGGDFGGDDGGGDFGGNDGGGDFGGGDFGGGDFGGGDIGGSDFGGGDF